MSALHKVHIECPECRGTGLYVGFMEAKGDAVICVRCGGTGRQEIYIKPYTGRKERRGIKRVRAGSGLILDTPGDSDWITYAEFKRQIKEPK
jgi:hypothetical protein